MPNLLKWIAVLAAVTLVGASSLMNYLFASSLGRSAFEGIVLGIVAVGVDVLKAVLAVMLGRAAHENHWGFFVIGSMAFGLFTALSFSAAIGFSATNRSAVLGARENQAARLAAIDVRIAGLRRQLSALQGHRPLSIIDEAIAVSRTDPRWSASRQCTLATLTSRDFCSTLGALRTERAAALEGDRLEGLLAAREAEAAQIRGIGGGLASDPQARALALFIGLDEAQVQRGLMALLALVIEVASGLGVYLALGDRPGRTAKDEEKSKPEPAADFKALPVEEPRPAVAIGVRPATRPVRRRGITIDTAPPSEG